MFSLCTLSFEKVVFFVSKCHSSDLYAFQKAYSSLDNLWWKNVSPFYKDSNFRKTVICSRIKVWLNTNQERIKLWLNINEFVSVRTITSKWLLNWRKRIKTWRGRIKFWTMKLKIWTKVWLNSNQLVSVRTKIPNWLLN